MVVTLTERKSRAIARSKAGFESATTSLAAYAAARGGRFVIFGSFARGDIHPDSDCDVMVDFPTNIARDARDAAETILREHGLVPDVHLVSEVSDGLMQRIQRDGVGLPCDALWSHP